MQKNVRLAESEWVGDSSMAVGCLGAGFGFPCTPFGGRSSPFSGGS